MGDLIVDYRGIQFTVEPRESRNGWLADFTLDVDDKAKAHQGRIAYRTKERAEIAAFASALQIIRKKHPAKP